MEKVPRFEVMALTAHATPEQRLACEVIRLAVRDLSSRDNNTTGDVRRSAMRFLLGDDDLELLDFWCQVAGIPTNEVRRYARRIADERGL